MTLAHLIDVELLREAYHQTRRDGAPGVDGVTAAEYAANLEANLTDLHARLRNGRYDAPPVKRTYVPKEDGSQRPIGMPTFEDKMVQRAVAMLLGVIYEQDFRDCSYGFREGRSPHQALHVLRERCGTGAVRIGTTRCERNTGSCARSCEGITSITVSVGTTASWKRSIGASSARGGAG